MPENDPLARLDRAAAAAVDDARASIAAGREPDADTLAGRIRAAAAAARAGGAAVDDAERTALARLERVLAVHRARRRLAETPRPQPQPRAPRPRLPGALRTRPTITGNMDVRRTGDAANATLQWDRSRGVAGWEVRVSERPDPRRDYVVRETRELPPDATQAAVPLGEHPVRVHLLGRGRDGRLVRRALISGLTRENWRDRWQRRASAA